jgi:hypothetical protein
MYCIVKKTGGVNMNKSKIGLCDICGTEIAYLRKCKLCDKKICFKCGVWYDIVGCGDCVKPYCIECWELGIPYRTEIEQLIIKHNNKIIKLEEKWSNRVKQDLAYKGNN